MKKLSKPISKLTGKGILGKKKKKFIQTKINMATSPATSENPAPLQSILVWILVGLITRWLILKIEGNINIILHEKNDSVL